MEEVVKEPKALYGDLYTYADYLRWEFEERLEILRGKIYWMSPGPSTTHQRLVGNFHIKFSQYFKGNSPCEIFLSPYDIRLPNTKNKSGKDEDVHTVFQPDLCVVCDENKIDERGCLGAPDFIIEILSPGNSIKEMNIKFDIYEEAGVREYWMVNYQEKHILQYVLENGKLIGRKPITIEESIQSHIFPELSFDVNEVFTFKK